MRVTNKIKAEQIAILGPMTEPSVKRGDIFYADLSPVVGSMTANYETRTVSSYLEEKMNQNDVAGSVAVTSIGAFPAIALSETVNDTVYTTCIYCYDGYLREITVSDGTAVLPGDGQKIIETKALAIDMVSLNLYCFTITDTTGYTYPLYISLNAKQP